MQQAIAPDELKRMRETWIGMKIAVIGDCCVDVYHYGISRKISQEAPVPILEQTDVQRSLGMAGNVGNLLIQMGCKPDLLTVVAGDSEIRTTNPANLLDFKITEKHRFMASTGGRPHVQVFREDLDLITESYKFTWHNERDYNAWLVADYAKGAINTEVLDEISKRGGFKILDPHPKGMYDELDSDWCVKCNIHERAALADAGFRGNIIMTQEAAGALLVRPGHDSVSFDVEPMSIVDVTGAGDAFLAGCTLGMLSTGSWDKAVILGNLFGTLECTLLGCAAFSFEELESWNENLWGRCNESPKGPAGPSDRFATHRE